MELKNFYIGKSKPINLKYGKQEIKQVFLSKELFYEQPINITINLSKGISSVVLTVVSTEEKTETHTLTQKSNVISVGYGYKIVFSNLVLQTNYSPSSNNPVMGKEYEVTKVSTYSFSASYIAPTTYYNLTITLGAGGESVMRNSSLITDYFERKLAEGSRVSLSEPTPKKGYIFKNYLINGSSIKKPSHNFFLANDTDVDVNFELETHYGEFKVNEGTAKTNSLRKIDNQVYGDLKLYITEDVSRTAVLASIPEGFRPTGIGSPSITFTINIWDNKTGEDVSRSGDYSFYRNSGQIVLDEDLQFGIFEGFDVKEAILTVSGSWTTTD